MKIAQSALEKNDIDMLWVKCAVANCSTISEVKLMLARLENIVENEIHIDDADIDTDDHEAIECAAVTSLNAKMIVLSKIRQSGSRAKVSAKEALSKVLVDRNSSKK